jgi:hypothetical protein
MPGRPMVIEGRVAIGATPQRVFDVLADPATWFRIDPTLVDVTPRERLVVGTSGTMRNRRGPGLVATATWTTTELIPGARLVQQLQGFGYELTEAVALEPHTVGTQMSVVDSLTPTSLAGRLMVALSRGVMERDLQTRFARLKALLEASETADG